MKPNFLYLLFIINLLIACNNSTNNKEKAVATPETYHSSELGWTIKIPNGFKLISQAKINANDEKGKEAIGKVYEGEVKIDSLRHLLSFSRNQFNLFDSTIEPYIEEKPGAYEANNQLIKKLLFDTYTKQGIKIDTSSGKVDIDGQKFYAFYIKLFGPNDTEMMNQVMFSRVMKGYDFGVNITYNSETDKQQLMDAFMNSRFSK